MDAANKFLDTDGLGYFIGETDPAVVKTADELTDPEFANENNIVIVWGALTEGRVKCACPTEIDFDTKFIYLGVGKSCDAPSSISVSGDLQTIVFEPTGVSYTIVRLRSSSTSPWSNTPTTINGTSVWTEDTTRASCVEVVTWYGPGDLELSGGVWGSNYAGSLSPAASYNVTARPAYGQDNN